MKRIIKKSLLLLLVTLIISTVWFPALAVEEISVESITQQIEALPAYEDFTAATDPGFEQALTDSFAVIESLAILTDDEFYMVENYMKVFDLYVGLTLMKMSDGMPTEIPTKEDVFPQLRWIYESTQIAPEYFSDLVYYSSNGEELYNQYSAEIMDVIIRISAAETTMTPDEQLAVEVQTMDMLLEAFPNEFTIENFWDYAYDFYYNVYEIEVDGLSEGSAAKVQSLQNSFDALVIDERFAVTEGVEKQIAAKCNPMEAEFSSELGKTLYHQPVCQEIWNNLDLLTELYEEDSSHFVKNYDDFLEYLELVYAVEPDWWYGDLDGDSLINAVDALIVLKMAVQKMEITEHALFTGDVDGNGVLDAKDALYILKYAVNKIEMFPVEEVIYG